MKSQNQLVVFTICAIMLFFLTGVLPALNFDDNVRFTVDKINSSEDLSFKSLSKQFNSTKNLTVRQVNENIVFEFKKPNYIFLYVNAEAEKEFKNNLPKQIYVKFV